MDPISTTLGSVALFAPFFHACKSIRHRYKLTETFGEDFYVQHRCIDTQYARLEQLSYRPVRDLTGHEHIEELDFKVQTLKSLLAEMKMYSDGCDELIGRYHRMYTMDLVSNLTQISHISTFSSLSHG